MARATDSQTLAFLFGDGVFTKIKEDLTSAPVLRHFDPALRTAVHIDGSQNAVGTVLLQWQANEDNPPSGGLHVS